MEQLPLYVPITFIITVLLATWLFVKAAHYSIRVVTIVTVWIVIQSALGLSGFYSDVATMTTRFPLLVLPPFIFLTSLFFTSKGKTFIDGLDSRVLTIFHSIRVLVEIVLFWLFIHSAIPEAMTFEGRNFDVLSGLTAPFIYYFGFVKKILSDKVMIAWNLVCMGLLVNVVSSAVLSLPDRFQQFGFEQPNIAVGYFPFLLLPAVLVPLAFFSNAASVRLAWKRGWNNA